MSAEELVDLNAERAVLGAALLEQSAVEAALDLLRADQFADARHRIVFGAVADLAKENEPVDILTVRSRLEHAGLLGEVGGPAFLTTLTEEITTAANVRHYAKLVGESWLRREIVDAAKAGTSAAELRYRIEKAMHRGHGAGGQLRGALEYAETWAKSTEILERQPPDRPYLLRAPGDRAGYLPASVVGMLAAAGAVGKSWSLVMLAISVATGREWFGFSVEMKGRVLLALAEEDADEFERRFYYASRMLRLTTEERAAVRHNVVPMPLSGVPVRLTYSSEELRTIGGGAGVSPELAATLETPFLRSLRRFIDAAEDGWRLLIFDPISRFGSADAEISNTAATAFIQACERLTYARGRPCVLLAHHTNQAARDDESKVTAASARGVTGLTDATRWVATLRAEPRIEGTTELVEFCTAKSNHGVYRDVMLCRDSSFRGALRVATDRERGERGGGEPVRKNGAGRLPAHLQP
jgi:hypothetical protein